MAVLSSSSYLKELKCEQNVLKNPDGSADYTEGDTNVLVAVYGPADCREGKQQIDKCYIDVSFRPKDGIPGVAEKYLEHTIKSICETVVLTKLHPRSQIVIIVQIVQDRGSLLSCAVNAVSMALQDAGVSMSCMPAAVALSIDRQDEEAMEEEEAKTEIIVTPSTEEEESSRAWLLFVFDSVEKSVICTNFKGTLVPSLYRRCLTAARTASESVFQFYRDSIAKKLSSNIRYA